MSWDRVHRRHELVHAVLASGLTTVPPGLAVEVDAEFGGFGGFLQEVQRRWYRAFDARLDAVLEEWPRDLHDALVRQWQDLALTMPAARRMLDANADHPALVGADEQHRRRLHAATGLVLSPASLTEPLAGRRKQCLWSLLLRTT
ncbi:hypothetical protein [Nonomuraea dietziae]|uniref:Uncharacterized protein n=1 Tax=Nonomuraea dietziae TaxID=65515 RepID=A0A7W5VD24_9ACTN|nr:hypothetical protein [Nonomuraea dietziae]MBB3725402.1 hypothetical protein [Nonomuraea dietziae]